MKKLLFIPILAVLIGCSGATQKIQTVWEIVTDSAVSPTQIVVIANAFDAAEVSATQFLLWCKQNPSNPECILSIRKKLVAAVRSGRAARNQLEPYITAGGAGPGAIYNSLVAAINILQTTIPSNVGGYK